MEVKGAPPCALLRVVVKILNFFKEVTIYATCAIRQYIYAFSDIGYYSSQSGSTQCVVCSAGWYSNDGISCNLCPAGQYSPTSAQSSCQICTVGTYAAQNGSIQCTVCPAGSYSNDSISCEFCPPGQYSQSPAQSGCQNCPAGTYYAESGASQCTLCPAGNYSDQEGVTYCEPCSPGTYSSKAGQPCLPCSDSLYNPSPGQSLCVSCPINSAPSENNTACDCVSGFYQTSNNDDDNDGDNDDGTVTCVACPAGGLCVSGLLRNAPGFWRTSISSTQFLQVYCLLLFITFIITISVAIYYFAINFTYYLLFAITFHYFTIINTITNTHYLLFTILLLYAVYYILLHQLQLPRL